MGRGVAHVRGRYGVRLLGEPAAILMPRERGGEGTALFPASPAPHTHPCLPAPPATYTHPKAMNVSPGMLRSRSLPRNSPWGYDWWTAFNTESFLIN